MADIATFVRGLAGQVPAAAAKTDPAVLATLDAEGRKDIEDVLGARQGSGKEDAVRIAYLKARKLYQPSIDAALNQGASTPAALASKLTEADDAESWDDWKAAAKALAEAFDLAKGITAERRKSYQDARAKAMDTISAAIGLPEIGGGPVAAGLAAADALAASGRWHNASDRLAQVHAEATRVSARAPYVRACRRHQEGIKGAFAITHNDLGKGFKSAWEQAVKSAESGAFEIAAQQVEALAARVEKARKDPVLTRARDAVAQARQENLAAMTAELGKGDALDVGALRALLAKEIGGAGAESLAAQATALGDDPGAKAREPIGDEIPTEQRFKDNDWFALKKKLHGGEISTEQMWDCWRYRREYVTRLIDSLRKDFPTLIAKTSGSNDLESDIDITFASAEPGQDVAAASRFNETVIKKFGKPPGRVFDVNIYPRDYNAIEESINPDYNLMPIADQDIDQPAGAMQKLSRVDQDVATLLKQRRFLDDAAFQELMEGVMAGAPDAATRKQIRKQFEEGEDIYLLTAFEKVDRIKAKLLGAGVASQSLALLNAFDALRNKGGAEDLARAQKLLPKVLDELENSHPAEVMEATDAQYLEKMAKLRQDQTLIARLDDPAADPSEHHKGSCEEVHKGQDHETWRVAEAERLKAQVKKDQFTNIVFANEAYMSQGAIEHVVAGIQAKDADKKAAAMARLTPATLMQSANEQLADFFKDMKTVDRELAAQKDETKRRRQTGEAFVHASKYLVRLLDAAQLMSEKFAAFKPPVPLEFTLLKTAGAATPLALKQRVESVLLALRKSATVPAEVKGEVGVDEVKTLFGVDDIAGFRALITAFGSQINQQVRRSPEFKAELSVDQAAERQYFGVPQMPADVKAQLDASETLVAAEVGSGFDAALGEAEAALEVAQELFDAVGEAGEVPKHLASRMETSVIDIEQILETLRNLSPKDAAAQSLALARKLAAQIKALEDYDDEDLHEAHVGDIGKAAASLRARLKAVSDAQADAAGEQKEMISALKSRLATLGKRLGKVA